MTAKIYIELNKYGDSGALFNAYHEGEKIISSKKNATFDAARVLVERGFTGKMEVYDHETKKLKGWMPLEWAATHTVEERSEGSLKFKKWYPKDHGVQDRTTENSEET